jgi:hypothetical protein
MTHQVSFAAVQSCRLPSPERRYPKRSCGLGCLALEFRTSNHQSIGEFSMLPDFSTSETPSNRLED